ncbi:MAG: hypothetical protein LJF30_04360 [Acidobacteria bacterium]|nr:hypothetical protein [Acidobacteriota bacterium]
MTRLAGALVFASTAVWVGACLAVLNGAVSSWVAWAALLSGAAAGAVAAWRTAAAAAGDVPAETAASLVAWLQGLPKLEALALTAFAVVSLRQFGWLLFARGDLLLTLLPNNYGDLPLHWTYVQHFAGGAPFWPESPIAVGERLRYPLGVDLLTALLVVVGVGARVVWPLLGLAGAAAAALALRRWGGALAVAGFLFSGGLAGFPLLWTGRLLDYQDAVAWKNLYLALFVPQRGFLLALPVGLLLLWSWRRRLLRGEAALPAWVEGVLWGSLPLVHLHTFLLVSVVYAVWALGGRRLEAAGPTLAWAVVPATWGVWQVSDGFRAVSLVGWQPGWVIGDENPLVFLAVNFGVFLPLALAALALAWRERRREELLVLGPALAVFAALFFVRLAPWAWDNTKVMLWCYLLALPPIGSLVLARLRRPWAALMVVGLLFSGAVSVTAASLGRGPRLEVLSLSEYDAVCAALASRPLTERVAAAPTFNHPVALCGHPLVLGYGGHLWSHGIDATEVERGLKAVLGGAPGWREEARAIGAELLFWGPREDVAYPDSLRPWEGEIEPLASGWWGRVYPLD